MIEIAGLIKPKEIQINDMDGLPLTFYVSRLPATVGREILCNYPITALPKIGSYQLNHELMLKLMSFVAVKLDSGLYIRLSTQALVDNHASDAETLMRLEHAALEYNSTFFSSGRLSSFFDECLRTVLAKISEISIPLSQQSSETDLQH